MQFCINCDTVVHLFQSAASTLCAIPASCNVWASHATTCCARMRLPVTRFQDRAPENNSQIKRGRARYCGDGIRQCATLPAHRVDGRREQGGRHGWRESDQGRYSQQLTQAVARRPHGPTLFIQRVLWCWCHAATVSASAEPQRQQRAPRPVP